MNNIQKIVLALVATTSIASASLADSEKFYLNLGGGVAFGTKPDKAVITEDPVLSSTFKSPKTGGLFSVGAGYYAMEDVRLELNYIKPFLGNAAIDEFKVNDVPSTTITGSLKFDQINAIQFKASYDAFAIADMGKAYVTAGVGAAQSKLKYSIDNSASAESFTLTSGNQYKFSWSLGVGANFDVADGVKLGLEYSYYDFGKVDYNKFKNGDAASNVTGSVKLRANTVAARLLFEI